MIWRHWGVTWATALLLCATLGAAQKPDVSVTRFHNLPARLFFFDDTSTAVYHDVNEGNVYISQDEGKHWDRADVPKGQAAMVVEHPFDNRYAFILTKGKTHYRTEDRGKTWRSFDMPIPVAYVANPLSFHSDRSKYGYILFQGTNCERGTGWGAVCHDETYYTKNAFADKPQLLLSETSRCQFAHSGKDFKHDAPADLIYCVGFDTSSGGSGAHSLSNSRLFSSTDFFDKDSRVEQLGIGKNARGVLAFAIVSKFAVVALKDLSPGNNGEMLLYVSVDAAQWAQAQFPHASSARLRENAYTIVESTTHSLGVDVVLQDLSTIGTLFVSNSNGTYFVESLKDTNRNEMGYVDFETIYGVEGVGIANVVGNAQEVEARKEPKRLQSRITFDDGRTWAPIRAPATDVDGKRIDCNPREPQECSLHVHSVTLPHNFGRIFSSPAPGFVMAVGSVGSSLRPYEECDTFMSTDAGVTWRMVKKDAHLYEFGDQGSVVVVVNDEEGVEQASYSTDSGSTWKTVDLGVRMKARALVTVADSTSQKFLLIGQLPRKDATSEGRYVTVFLDFAPTRSRQCTDRDFEKWYARTLKDKECLMGHKQWYNRRKPDADCYVGHKFDDPVEHEDNCPCDDDDYECDYNYVRSGDKCIPMGPEPIAPGLCKTGEPNEMYLGSSGYRLIPGNTCDKDRGVKKDQQVEKKCSQAQVPEGEVAHAITEFPAHITEHAYFKDASTILARLADGSIYQSSNEGYVWHEPFPNEKFLAFYMHTYSTDRAYLITSGTNHYYTTDTGKTWNPFKTKTPPNAFGAGVLRFHPRSDNLIWTGNADCESNMARNCHAEAHYSTDNGRSWRLVEKYVRNCQWARDTDLVADPTEIICESYRDKKGNQKAFMYSNENPLQLVTGTGYFSKKTKVFDQVVGFAKFSEFLVVAEYQAARNSLDLQVSLDGKNFASGMFPPSTRPEQHAYTVLESSTKSLFLHVTTSESPAPAWGSILKSNSNGTYFTISQDYVNRDDRGYVDFEKMIGLDGIALINIVANPNDAAVHGGKLLQSRISHNDGGSWRPLVPPKVDSQGQSYECNSVKCALHVHGYTERRDPRATYSTPSVPGLLMAVGNVGETLMRYTESDTFLSRDAGFSWEEVHKDAHMWEFGDSGSILVMANDEEPTDHVLFTTDEGLTWREYKFGGEKLRVQSIVTVPMDTSRKFILFGTYSRSAASVAIHIDFSSLTLKKCVLSLENPGHDDFELWSPAEERQETCLFGRKTLYHRRRRDVNCVVGNQPKAQEKVVETCPCRQIDFECEFNHQMNVDGKCVLIPGLTPLASDDHECWEGEDFWYDRTAYRKVPYSTCQGGSRPDRGTRHVCPGFKAHGSAFWWIIFFLPFGVTALVAYYYYKRNGLSRGTIRLPGDTGPRYSSDSGALATLASVPWFLVGLAGIAWEYVASSASNLGNQFESRRGYRNLPVDEDAQILRFEDEE